jgi:molecular chaperone GrpE
MDKHQDQKNHEKEETLEQNAEQVGTKKAEPKVRDGKTDPKVENEKTESKVEKDEGSLEEFKKKLQEYEDMLKRQVADFDNFRKRTQEEKEKLKDYAFDAIFLDFIPIFDNIERAMLASNSKDATIKSIVEGLEGITQLFKTFLEKYQVEKLDSINKEFDPAIHEALFTQEGDYDKKIVTQEVEKAYKRKDKVIRTAKVAVGIPKKEKEEN